MATIPSTYTVKPGDTLLDIAVTYFGDGTKYKQIAALNNISNPDYITPGQVLKLTGTSSSSGSSSSSDSDRAKINTFGPMSKDPNTLFAVWTWDQSSKTDKYEYEWSYTTGDKSNGKVVWFTASKSSTEDLVTTQSIPENSQRICFRVKPISKTYKDSNNNEVTYFEAKWSEYKYHTVEELPVTPSTPTVSVDNLTLKAELNNVNPDDLNATSIEFQIVKDNKSALPIGKSTINKTSNYASYSCSVAEGSEYKVRCRSVRGSLVSEWSSYTSSVATRPGKPKGFTTVAAKQDSATGVLSVYLKWDAVKSADSYELEYSTRKDLFDISDQTTKETVVGRTQHETDSLESGNEWFVRFRAINEAGESPWSDISSIILGEAPAAPTTWSSSTTASVDGPLTLYWVHNSKDGSSQKFAMVSMELYVDGVLKDTLRELLIYEITADEKDKTKSFDAAAYLKEKAPTLYKDGLQLRWRVRTAGVTNEFSEYSVVRVVDIYANPTVSIEVSDSSHILDSTHEFIGSYPIYISATTSPATQAPIGFHLIITSNEIYDTVDNIGNDKTVNAGEQVYSKYFDVSTDLSRVELSASDVDLENGISYTLTCVASMNSGLTAETYQEFVVWWNDVSYTPNASITYDPETVVTHIQPYCMTYNKTFYKVIKKGIVYTSTTQEVNISQGSLLKDIFTTDGKAVYSGYTAITINEDGTIDGGEAIYYYETQVGTPVEDVTLSVYRREFDGSYTELATGIDNTKNVFVTDPHPSLDYARYRIVATTGSTGAVGYYDVPGYPIGEKAVIIQWNEDWTTFDVTNDDPLEQPPWSGSLLRLPYNIDVSDSYGMDISLIKYVGRKRPVSYYGTQLGESSTWSVNVPKYDKDTIYALRRLAIWSGDAYVREPSGSGYWANVNVSFSQNHCDLVVPVTLTLTRVEGGA